MKEFECVVLLRDVPEEGLISGDRGTIVDVSPVDRRWIEVEFFDIHGDTVTVASLEASDVRLATESDMQHARFRDPVKA